MPTGLAEFRLPGHIAERKARESLPELDMDLSCSIHTQNSSASELPSPVTPTFSTRGHMRHPSSASSIESQYLYESPSSPTFTSHKSGKRSLPDVQEEPPRERENDFMFEDDDDDDILDCDELYNCLCKSPSHLYSYHVLWVLHKFFIYLYIYLLFTLLWWLRGVVDHREIHTYSLVAIWRAIANPCFS